MSGRLCCYKQQQHSKPLAQFVFKVSAFRFNTRTKTRAPLPDCRINNALIQFVPSCQDMQTQFIDILDPPFSDNPCSIILCLVVGIFMPKNSIVTKFCHLALGGPVIMPHRVYTSQWIDASLPLHLYVFFHTYEILAKSLHTTMCLCSNVLTRSREFLTKRRGVRRS